MLTVEDTIHAGRSHYPTGCGTSAGDGDCRECANG